MSTNKDLQATHEIIQLFETSKASLENILDQLPDLFSMIDSAGVILKGNQALAHCLGVDIELTLGLSVRALFSEQSWNIFMTHFNDVISNSVSEVEFELSLISKGQVECIYFWSIKSLAMAGENNSIFCLSGRDITKIRSYEKQLSQIFANIPVSLMTITFDGKIEAPFSEYSRWLLGQQVLAGQKIKAVVFESSWQHFSDVEKKSIAVLENFENISKADFFAAESTLPKKFKLILPKESKDEFRWIGLKYLPLEYENVVKKVLIIIEDLSSLEK